MAITKRQHTQRNRLCSRQRNGLHKRRRSDKTFLIRHRPKNPTGNNKTKKERLFCESTKTKYGHTGQKQVPGRAMKPIITRELLRRQECRGLLQPASEIHINCGKPQYTENHYNTTQISP